MSDTAVTRAAVVPLDARNALDNSNNLSVDGRATCEVRLVTAAGQQQVRVVLPNWLRIVLHYAGTNDGLAERLPGRVDLPVVVDASSGAVVEVLVDQAAEELRPFRDVAARWWKETEAPLADLRQVVQAPGDAVKGARDLLRAWRSGLSRLRDDGAPAHDGRDAEQARRTAATVGHHLDRDPGRRSKHRDSALQAGPMMVENVRSGSMAAADFESWLAFQVGSGAVDPAEADAWRRAATGPSST